MNWSLLRAPLAMFLAVAIVGGFGGWYLVTGVAFGSREGDAVPLLLWSGWTALGLMVFACLYSLRKFVHKLGISPEFRMRVPIRQMESAESRLSVLRRQIAIGAITTRADVESLAKAILDEEGASRVVRLVVREGQPGGAPFEIDTPPREPLRRVARWLHFHAYLGLAAGVLVWFHGGGHLAASPIGLAMNLLTLLVVVTGVIGILLWARGPSWLAAAEKDMGFERAFVLDRSLRDKITAAIAGLGGFAASTSDKLAESAEELRTSMRRVRAAADEVGAPADPATDEDKKVIDALAKLAKAAGASAKEIGKAAQSLGTAFQPPQLPGAPAASAAALGGRYQAVATSAVALQKSLATIEKDPLKLIATPEAAVAGQELLDELSALASIVGATCAANVEAARVRLAAMRQTRGVADGATATQLLGSFADGSAVPYDEVQRTLALIGQHQRVLEVLVGLRRIKFWMNAWRLVHIPATILLMGLAVLHVLSVWYY